jgi:hypothetical protein
MEMGQSCQNWGKRLNFEPVTAMKGSAAATAAIRGYEDHPRILSQFLFQIVTARHLSTHLPGTDEIAAKAGPRDAADGFGRR